jgi:predicted glycoside hydrolase/deacetylase ChbG (UPF0249 family)
LAVRRLIVNADDFGLTAGVNRAIIEAHRAGIVTSTTLMANSAAYDEAILLAQQAPRLGVGVHLVFVDGRPIVSPTSIRTLAPGRHSRFRGSIALLAANALLARLNPNEIEREAGAQIRKIKRQACSYLTSTPTNTLIYFRIFSSRFCALRRDVGFRPSAIRWSQHSRKCPRLHNGSAERKSACCAF